MNFIFLLSYNERFRGENTGWKRKFFIFLHKKYPYDFKIEIIGVFSSTYSTEYFIFCFVIIHSSISPIKQGNYRIRIISNTYISTNKAISFLFEINCLSYVLFNFYVLNEFLSVNTLSKAILPCKYIVFQLEISIVSCFSPSLDNESLMFSRKLA